MIEFNKEEFRLTHSQMHIIAMESNNTLHAVLMAQDFIVKNVVKALLQAGAVIAEKTIA